MENHSDKIEKDAVPSAADSSGIVSTLDERSELLDLNDNVQQSVAAVNNNLIMAQTNSTSVMTSNVMTFNQCSGINLGTTVHIGWSPGSSGGVARQSNSVTRKDETVYQKTPTIKAMLESNELISTAFLDYISGYFGSRWREIMILLEINQLFCDRMYEDNFDKGGTKEVVFQILSNYFKDHQDHSTIGWLISFLWNNGFRKTVWSVKDHYKRLKELENDFE